MKLYATIKSERASKGQGGKELTIEILGESRVKLWTLFVEPHGEGYKLSVARMSDEFPKYRLVDYENEKGERQKGEREICVHCG